MHKSLISGVRCALCILLIIIGYVLCMRGHTMHINDFFPGINGNLTKITWAHAVNNKTHLSDALNSTVMMLEADVVYGQINGSGPFIPIMGHPPANTSDLSLEEFLMTTFDFNMDTRNKSSRKGVKLDFKSTYVFLKSINLIQKLYSLIDYPLWLNADIIKGPVSSNPPTPVDSNVFLSNAKSFNDSVLSLGWTTMQPSETVTYTDDQVSNMISAIENNHITQDITFAVRAGIASRSFRQMKTLKDSINNCTLTVWSSEGDDVDVPKLRDVIFEYGVKRVYVDVPEDLRNRLDLGNSGNSVASSSIVTTVIALFITVMSFL